MSISGIHSPRPQPAGDPVAFRYARQNGGPKAAPAAAKSTIPAENASELAAAIASAMAQLGLTAAPGHAVAGAAIGTATMGTTRTATAPVNTSSAILPGSRQVQQYKDTAATFSGLAQALDFNAGGPSPTSGQAINGLTAIFQSLWTALGAASDTRAAISGNPAMPNLQAFIQSVASHFGESGIPNLRGVFIDTVA
ncbi:MAG: hypothetical protein KGK06_03440 [Xanthomonadaceae bacterium]|nr:hypothetical protein [Xanthomonadaceae bacterium]